MIDFAFSSSIHLNTVDKQNNAQFVYKSQDNFGIVSYSLVFVGVMLFASMDVV